MVEGTGGQGAGPLLAGLADALDDLSPCARAGAGEPGHGVVGCRAGREKGGEWGRHKSMLPPMPAAQLHNQHHPASFLISSAKGVCIGVGAAQLHSMP